MKRSGKKEILWEERVEHRYVSDMSIREWNKKTAKTLQNIAKSYFLLLLNCPFVV
jgi:hypothetical protein